MLDILIKSSSEAPELTEFWNSDCIFVCSCDFASSFCSDIANLSASISFDVLIVSWKSTCIFVESFGVVI